MAEIDDAEPATPLILVIPAVIMQRRNFDEISDHAKYLLKIELEIFGIQQPDASPSNVSEQAESVKSGSGNESDDSFSFCASSKAPSSRLSFRAPSIASDISIVNNEQDLLDEFFIPNNALPARSVVTPTPIQSGSEVQIPASTLDQLFIATKTLQEQQLGLESLMKSLSIQSNETFESLKDCSEKNVAAIESLLSQFKTLHMSEEVMKEIEEPSTPKADTKEHDRDSATPDLKAKPRSRKSSDTKEITPQYKKQKLSLFEKLKQDEEKIKKEERKARIEKKKAMKEAEEKTTLSVYDRINQDDDLGRKKAMKEVEDLLKLTDIAKKKLTPKQDDAARAAQRKKDSEDWDKWNQAREARAKENATEAAAKFNLEKEVSDFTKNNSYFDILRHSATSGHSMNETMNRIYDFQCLIRENKFDEAKVCVNLRDELDEFLEQIVRSIFMKVIWYNNQENVNIQCAQLALDLQSTCSIVYAKKQMYRKHVTNVVTELFEKRCIPFGLCTPAVTRHEGFTSNEVKKYEQLLTILRFAAELYNVGMLELSLIKWFILRLQITAPNIEQFATLPCNESAIDLALSIVGVIQDRLVEEDTEYLFWVTEAINNITEYFSEQKFNQEDSMLGHFPAGSVKVDDGIIAQQEEILSNIVKPQNHSTAPPSAELNKNLKVDWWAETNDEISDGNSVPPVYDDNNFPSEWPPHSSILDQDSEYGGLWKEKTTSEGFMKSPERKDDEPYFPVSENLFSDVNFIDEPSTSGTQNDSGSNSMDGN